MTITSLMDDLCPRRGLKGEHGLSLFIISGTSSLLFDSGSSGACIENSQALGIDLSTLDAVVLSHGHYDHGGGLPAVYEFARGDPPPLFVGRGFDARRLARDGDSTVDIGLPRPLLPEGLSASIVADAVEEIVQGLYALSRAEMVHAASIDPRFRALSGSDERPDGFDDELSLVAVGDEGLSVITGCAHRGILNIVEAARLSFPGRPIRAVVGGFHLSSLPDDVLESIARDLAAMEPGAVYCCHCTGARGYAALRRELGGKVEWLSCGMRITI
jgi:7,8-dihydropterin-6-yl-methyl-4-(beta-D-ribofuranosyl)aminobenzene 5'-phosphate synthase